MLRTHELVLRMRYDVCRYEAPVVLECALGVPVLQVHVSIGWNYYPLPFWAGVDGVRASKCRI